MSEEKDTGAPFGTVYFGAILAIGGGALTVTTGSPIGPVAAICGVMFVCTGMVLRGLYRLR